MALQSLTPPQDITWKRMAYSRDMIDTNFNDLSFTPKWRSSLALYYYIVPEEDTADAYPDSKVVYLKLTCSITGWNPSEVLKDARKTEEASGALDDLQKSIWETITSQGWASAYYPCLGAIMQVGIYPGKNEQAGPDDFPYIIDFEPKKRELYEMVSEGSEVLSGSLDKVSITKGTTNTQSVGASVSGGIPLISGSVSANASWEQVNNNVTDTSKENRETLSRTSSFSQMYQLFNGYHLGTNRALFLVAPRPHTVGNQAQTEFNLINGERKLEGIQEMFLVVLVPNKLTGFCIQASLDTGHTVQENATTTYIMKDNSYDIPEDGEVPPLPDPPDPDPEPSEQLVVTRRIIQNCGVFDENGNFTLVGGGRERPPFDHSIVWEDLIRSISREDPKQKLSTIIDRGSVQDKITIANHMNVMQSRIIKSMVSGISSATYEPRQFTQTKAFLRLAGASLRNRNISLEALKTMGYLDAETIGLLKRSKINNLADLFDADNKRLVETDLKRIRAAVLRKALPKRPR